jgi:nitrogen fixation NifU-like protein
MTDALKGRSVGEADALFQEFHRMVTAPVDAPVEIGRLDKLAVFSGVREYPVRVKCASLAWHTLRAALEAKEDVVSTE